MSDNLSNSDTPLPTLRARDLCRRVQDAITPLPTLWAPATSCMDVDYVTPMPTLRVRRAVSPTAMEPEEENRHTLPFEAPNATAATQPEDNEHIENPVIRQDAQTAQANSPFLTPSTDRSMVGQTIRSFETRTGTTSAPRAKTNNLGRTTSATVVVFDDIAPSDLEIYEQAGLIPPTKGEKVGEHRNRVDDNFLWAGTKEVATCCRIGELEVMVDGKFKEVTLHIKDIINSPATASTVPPTLLADIERLKTLTMEGCTALSSLTLAMDPLVDLPREVERLSRAVQSLVATSHNSSGQANRATAPQHELMDADMARGSLKRDRPYAGFEAPEAAKRHKPTNDKPHYVDVYLHDVNTAIDSPTTIASKVIERLGMSMNDLVSALHPRNTPKTVISIRFNTIDLADEFIDRVRSNPPASMARLHVVKPAVYAKKTVKSSEQDPW